LQESRLPENRLTGGPATRGPAAQFQEKVGFQPPPLLARRLPQWESTQWKLPQMDRLERALAPWRPRLGNCFWSEWQNRRFPAEVSQQPGPSGGLFLGLALLYLFSFSRR